MPQDRICVWCQEGQTMYQNAPEADGTNCTNPPHCPCENILNLPYAAAAGVTQVFTLFHPDPTFNTVDETFDPCAVTNATICYTCNASNTGYLSQTITTGGGCPTGWSTTIPTCGGGEDPSSGCPPAGAGCNVCFEEQCTSDGSLQVSVTIGTDFKNVQIQNGAQNTQLNTCGAISPNPFLFSTIAGQTITVTGYCGSPTIYDSWNKNSSSVEQPEWAEPDCGDAAVTSTTKIICFYDTTSLGATAQANMYTAANAWIKGIQTSDGYTGEVYHVAIGGERWVLWPAWLLDKTIDIDGVNRTSFASACGAGTPSSNWDAAEGVLSAWNSDANAYVQATGSQGATKAMPAQIAAGEDVLVIIFADEVADQPNGYTATNTGAASGSSAPDIGGYHKRSSADNNSTVITHAQSIYDVTIPACINATANSNGWNLWEWDYNTAVPKIAAHNSGSGSIKTYIYPSQPVGSTPGDMRRSFPFHVWLAVNSGYNNTGLLQNGATKPTCLIADLANTVQDGGGTLINWYVQNNVGKLDQHGFGANVECKAFTALDFEADLNAFLTLNATTCDSTDCAKVRMLKPDGSPIVGEQVTIGSNNLTTDANGDTPMVSGLAGAVSINGCYTHNFTGDCTQYLFQQIKEESSYTTTQVCILGCTDPNAMNYNPNANVDDGSCEYCIWGCTNPISLNYDPNATCDDGSCQEIPDIVECTLVNMAKELLKQCHTECGEPEKYLEMQEDFREMEAMLAQIYMLIECNNITELQALMPMILRLMEKYQCDSCYQYTSVEGDTTITQDETSATTCGVTISGPCTNTVLTPTQDALQIETKLPNGAWNLQSTTTPTVLGDISGQTLDVRSYCGPIQIDKALDACGFETIPNDTNIYCFYDVTSTCAHDIIEIVNAVELWFQSKCINDPSYSGDVYHLPVHGEKWVRCGEYPIDQQLHAASLSLVNGPSNDLGGGNKGYSTTLQVNVLDRSTIGTTHTMVSRTMYGPKSGTASFNDIITDPTGGALPYLRPGASYNDQGAAMGGTPDDKAVVLCFFDEAEGSQGGGAYHDRGHPGDSNYGYTPTGIIEDFGTAPRSKWITDYNSFVAKYPSYEFFKGFLYPVVPGIHTSTADCGVSITEANAPSYNPNAEPHTGKLSFILNALAGIHKGVWNVATDGPVPINPVISAQAHPGNANVTAGTMGNLDAITLAANPYVAQNVDGLSDYGWSMDPTVGTPGTNLISGVFTSGQFNTTLDALLSGGALCDGTDCLTVIIKDADTGAVIPNDQYTQTQVTVQPGTHNLLHPLNGDVTLQTDGNCTEYIVTMFKDVMDQYTDCVITTAVTCGCGGDPSIVISTGSGSTINSNCDSGEDNYGTITNETTGVTDDIIFDPNLPGPLSGGITLDTTLKNSSFFQPGTELPDGRYKIVLTDVDGEEKEFCFLILCDSYAKLLDAFERYTLQIECCPTCTSPYDKYLEAYTLYRVLKVTGIDCGLEKWIDKTITKLQSCCKSCAADADCDQTC